MEFSKEEIAEFLSVAKEAAKKAGALLREGFNTSFTVREKEGRKNLVTSFDEKCEELILGILREKFPDHNILSEECGQKGSAKDRVTWIVDPLDGTVNFAYSIPVFAVSIAATCGADTLAGVVYAPMTNELFSSAKGSGAYLNDKQIAVSAQNELDESLLATGLPYNSHENPRHCIEHLSSIVNRGIPLRRLGSAAIDLAYVACGRFDGFWESTLNPWDFAAGKLFVEEAGGRLTDIEGKPLQKFTESSIIATNMHIHDALVTHFRNDHG